MLLRKSLQVRAIFLYKILCVNYIYQVLCLLIIKCMILPLIFLVCILESTTYKICYFSHRIVSSDIYIYFISAFHICLN